MAVSIKLKPARQETADSLRQKSDNCINPYVAFEAKASKPVTAIIDHIAKKLFKEDPKKVVFKVDNTEYNYMRCEDHGIKLQDLIMLQDTDILEQILQDDSHKKQYKMTIKYDILTEIPDYQPEKEVEDQLCFPEDLSEAELVEMLTEVMSIMLFNKDEKMQELQSAANADKKT